MTHSSISKCVVCCTCERACVCVVGSVKFVQPVVVVVVVFSGFALMINTSILIVAVAAAAAVIGGLPSSKRARSSIFAIYSIYAKAHDAVVLQC